MGVIMEYNCRVYDYPTGQHVTIYKRTITRSDDTGNEEDFLKVYGSSITYCKSVTIPEAHQQINYYEIR